MTQAETVRGLEEQLAALERRPASNVQRHTDVLNELAWKLSDIDAKRAYALGEEAYALACEPGGSGVPHQAGIAGSLRTLGYLNQRLGNHPLGLSQLLKALELCEALHLTELLPDVLDGIAGVYFQIGDFPTSLDYIHRQLAAAQRIDDKRRVANALNNLANIYLEMGDYASADATLRRNLQLADEIGYDRIRALALLDLAETWRMTGDAAQALDWIGRGLEVSQQAGFAVFEVYAYEIAGKIYLHKGDAAAALPHLDKALASSKVLDSRLTEALILLDLGQAYRELQRPALALESLQQGVAVASAIDAKNELSTACRLLAEVYEDLGDAARALEHFKQHLALRELVAGEKVEQRLQVLQVAHDTAAAKQEAEVARLRTVELSAMNEQLEQQVVVRTAELTQTVALLQQEIQVRERAEAEIQQLVATLEQRVVARTDELATFFDLTLLAGQSADLNDVFDQALARILEVTRSRALCIHLFDDKHTSLRLAAQQSLPGAAQEALRTVHPEAGFAQWLHQPHGPLMTADLASLASLPAPFRVPGYGTYLGAQVRIGGQVGGLLSCYRFTDRGYGIDEVALVTALAEQLGMMLETRRLRQHAAAMAVLEERQRLARDLHDSVTQSLYSLTLFSRAAREAADDGDTARLARNLTELERNTLHALREMRLLLYELRPADLEQEGLARAIQLRLDTVEQRVGLQLDVHVDHLPALAPAQEVELYHIVVEALNNVVKHAAASRLAVELSRSDGQLHLRIADDGQGFDPVQAQGGLGLRNIRERVARLNGRLSIESSPGSGTRLDAFFRYPVEEGR